MSFLRHNWGWLVFIVLLVAGFLGVIFFYPLQSSSALGKAPNFALSSTEGTIYMEELRGRPIVLNFWATWCIFCRDEMPELEELRKEYGPEELVILGVHRTATESFEAGLAFAREIGITYPLIRDSAEGSIFNHFARGSFVTPMTVFIDREGFVKETIIGPRRKDQFRELIEELIRDNGE